MNARATTSPVQHSDRFFIGGEWVAPSSDATVDVIDSGTEEVYYTIAAAAPDDMTRAGRRGAAGVRRRPVGRGSRTPSAPSTSSRWAKALSERGDALSPAVAARVGRPLLHVAVRGAHRLGCARGVRGAGRHVPVRGGVRARPAAASSVSSCASRSAWSARSSRGTRRSRSSATRSAPRSSPGCTVVLKSAPEAPGEGYVFAEAAEQIGLPPGVLNVVTADREVSELLVTNPGVDKITFTGSTAAGRRIASLCGERIARCTLELGGKSAAVDPRRHGPRHRGQDAREGRVRAQRPGVLVAHARSSSRRAATTSSSTRSRRASARPASATRSTRRRSSGRSSSERQRDRVLGYIAKGVDEGATLATGGGRPQDLDRGYYVEPTVFGNVDNGSTIGREEIFGPVLAVIKADDEQDAVRHRERHDLRAQRVGVHERRRPRPRGRRRAAVRHGRPQRLPHRLRHGVRRLQAVGHRPRGRQGRSAAVPRDQDRDPRGPARGVRFGRLTDIDHNRIGESHAS